MPTSVTDIIAQFQSIIESVKTLDPFVIGFLVGIGVIIGYALGWVFTGVGNVEQRLIARNYASGYRKGFNDARHSKMRDFEDYN